MAQQRMITDGGRAGRGSRAAHLTGSLVAAATAIALCAAPAAASAGRPGPASRAAASRAGLAAPLSRAAAAAAGRAACGQPSARPRVTATARAAATAPAPAAVIRVDQVGYPATAPKLAEIMTTGRPAGARWLLVRAGSCAAAASGLSRRDLGAWSKRYDRVWAVTFTAVHRPGRYRLALAADPSVVSPWFGIGPAARLYARPLASARYFYENERDGPDFVRTALRTAPGHLNDRSAMTFRTPPVDGNGDFRGSLRRFATGVRINATGGWFDAGDYLHFAETTSYTEALMEQGAISFPRQLGPGAATSLYGEARFGMDFLRRMWDQRTRTLYYQVGTGEANNYYFGDHDIWRLPQADDSYRGTNPRYRYIRHPPVFRAGPPGAQISPNLAGRWPPTSRSATGCSGPPTRATQPAACARPRPSTRWPIPGGGAS